MNNLIKFLAHVDMVKITCIDSTSIVEEARKLQGLNPTPTAALGRLLTMASMMGADLKSEQEFIKFINRTVKPLCDICDRRHSEKSGYKQQPRHNIHGIFFHPCHAVI